MPYCPRCRGHLHNIDHLRADHRVLAENQAALHAREIELQERKVEAHSQAVEAVRADLKALVSSVADDFVETPSANLLRILSSETLLNLQKRADDAYYARDRAMAAVWRMDDLHHVPVSGDKCACGKVLQSCREYRAIDFFRESYYQWERRQIDLMYDDKMHGLPADHPKAREYGSDDYRWKGAKATEPLARGRR